MAGDLSSLERFKKRQSGNSTKTADLSAFGRGTVEIREEPIRPPLGTGLVKELSRKAPGLLKSKLSQYIKSEEDIRQGLTLGQQFKRDIITKPAQVAKFIVQGAAQSVLGLGRSIQEATVTPFGGKEKVRETFKDRGTQADDWEKTLFGDKVGSYQEMTEKIQSFVDKAPQSTPSEKKFLAPVMGLALFAADAFPGKPSAKKEALNLFEELAKDVNPISIERKLIDTGIDTTTAKNITPKLVEAGDIQTVRRIIAEESGDRVAKLIDQEDMVIPKMQNIDDFVKQRTPDYARNSIDSNGYYTERRFPDSAYAKTFVANEDIPDTVIKKGDKVALIKDGDRFEAVLAEEKVSPESGFRITKENNIDPTKFTSESQLEETSIKPSKIETERPEIESVVTPEKAPERFTGLTDEVETSQINDLIRRDQVSLRPVRTRGSMDIKGRDLRKEMEDNIKRYNTKIPDIEIQKIREQNLLNPETIDEIIARKRGIITDAEAIERARTIQGTISDVLKLPKGTLVTKEQYTAIEQIVQNEREINKSLRIALDEGTVTGGASERKLLVKSNPDFADKTDQQLLQLAFQESTLKLKKAEIVLLGIRSEAGRTLQATKQFVEGVDNRLRILFSRINNNKKLDEFEKQSMVETITKLDTANDKAFMKALDDMSQSDMFDKVAEWSVAAKLWNPTTHIVNLGGNAIRQIIDIGIKTVTNPKLAKADMAGALHGLKLGIRGALKTFTDDGYAQQLSKYIELGGKAPALKGKFGTVARTPFRVLAAGDEIFRNMAYQRKLYRDAYTKAKKEKLDSPQLERRMEELLNTPTFQMMEDATREAKKLTFQEDLGDIVSKINRFRDPSTYKSTGGKTLGVVLRTFLPFLKTPTNLFKQSVDFSPFGLVKNWGDLKKAAKEGDQEKVGTILGEAILGTALITYIALETQEGNITGGIPSDPAEKDRFYREKKLPYAIKIGDTWHQYQRLDPLALVIGMTSDMTDADEKTIGALVGTMSQNLQDKTYLSGVSDFMKMLTGEEWEREYAIKSALLGSAFPSFIGHIARSIDPSVRVSDTIGQRLIAQTPGLSEELPGKVNVLGYDIERANKGLNYFFNPIQSTSATIDPVTRNLMMIDKTISVPNKTFKRDNVQYDLNAREYEDFSRFTGVKMRHELVNLFKSPQYKNLTDEEKSAKIDTIRKEVMDEWKDEYVEEQTGRVARIKKIREQFTGNSTSEQIKNYFLGE